MYDFRHFWGPNELSVIERCPYGELRLYIKGNYVSDPKDIFHVTNKWRCTSENAFEPFEIILGQLRHNASFIGLLTDTTLKTKAK